MELSVLQDIVIIFALSTLVNLLFSKIKVPTIVGYLLTGIIAGPHLMALVHDTHDIELMAEIGVILLLFGIGMEFSLKHLLRIRRVVFLGGFVQMLVTAGVFYFVTFVYNLPYSTGLFIGFIAALSSSALVLKLLQERSELTSNYGRTVLGILIFQDLMLVPLILYANLLGTENVNVAREIFVLGIKALIIIALVYVGNKWLLPKLLHVIALAKNPELFMMSIFLICLSIALLTAELGMSLAFGAFLAGLMISESEYSHNAFGNLIPFKDTFTSFFFVSIGMLLDMSFVLANLQLVIFSVILVLVVKSVIAGGTGFILGHTFRGTVLVGLALCQVGEFSFVLAKIGLTYSILSNFYYQLFLAVAVITMAFTPFLIKLALPLANLLMKLPLPKFLVEGLFPLQEIDVPEMSNHLVIIGKDASALKLAMMAKQNSIPHISIIFDPVIAREQQKKGKTVIYGDAVNDPILRKAHTELAEIVVISVGSIIPSMAIIEKVRRLNKNVFIIVRAKYTKNMESLFAVGANQIIPEKLEIAIDFFNRILVKRLVPQKEINRMINHLRSDYFGILREQEPRKDATILDEFSIVEINTLEVELNSVIEGKTLREIDLRKKTGVTLMAIRRGNEVIEHPVQKTILLNGDIVYVLGNPEQINLASELFSEITD